MTRSIESHSGEGKRTRRPGAWVTVVGVGLLALPLLRASEVFAGEHDDMTAMIEKAKTAADHEAIAAQYEKQAADAKQEADRHRKMEKSYAVGAAGGKGTPTPLPQHCAALAKHYDSIAQEDTTLAAAHRDMAKAAK